MRHEEINLSLLKSPTLIFENTIGASKESINTPIIYNNCVIGIVADITEKNIHCRIWDKFVEFHPEYNSPDGIEAFKLFGINISSLEETFEWEKLF